MKCQILFSSKKKDKIFPLENRNWRFMQIVFVERCGAVVKRRTRDR